MPISSGFSVNKRRLALSDPEFTEGESKGFTLIELLVVISIIAILSVIGMAVFTGVQNNARNVKVTADFDAMYKNIEQARVLKQQVLGKITNNWWSEGSCNSTPPDWPACLSKMTTSYATVTTATLPTDPWGHPYMWDENEGEPNINCNVNTGCCNKDFIRSVGPNGLYGDGDDKPYYVPLSGYTGC